MNLLLNIASWNDWFWNFHHPLNLLGFLETRVGFDAVRLGFEWKGTPRKKIRREREEKRSRGWPPQRWKTILKDSYCCFNFESGSIFSILLQRNNPTLTLWGRASPSVMIQNQNSVCEKNIFVAARLPTGSATTHTKKRLGLHTKMFVDRCEPPLPVAAR